MIRASQVHRICTNRPFFDSKEFTTAMIDLQSSKFFEKESFEGTKIEIYCGTKGIATKAKLVKKLLDNKRLVKEDPLPDGAKSYLQEVWLNSYGLYDFSLKENDPTVLKGKLQEDFCIGRVEELYGIPMTKNIIRKNLLGDFFTGECDIEYGDVIRDIKCPIDWKSFRKKDGIEIPYKWQLIAYSILYAKSLNCDLYLDYVLVKNPTEIHKHITRNMSQEELLNYAEQEILIGNLTPSQSIKTFKYDGDLKKDQDFMKSRIEKSKEYYDSLTYEKCMHINGN